MQIILKSILFFLCFISYGQKKDSISSYGNLIFYDNFDRNESQEFKDEVGDNWTTSSNKTAKGHKEVDLRDGYMYIYIHEEANHAVSVRHKMGFKDGAIEVDFKLDHKDDVLVLNIADPSCESVHAGHLINVKVKANSLELYDLKTGIFDLNHYMSRKSQGLTQEQKEFYKTKVKKIDNIIELGKWCTVIVKIQDDKIVVYINGKEKGSFASVGFSHHSKDLLRILVPRNVSVDNLKVWKKK